jgi:hypothetical protein
MAEGSPELNEAEMSELERLQLRINQKSDETLESTRRMREMCAEAKVGLFAFYSNISVARFYESIYRAPGG